MMAKIGFYVLFLCALVGYSRLTQYMQRKQLDQLTDRRGGNFFSSQLGIASGLILIIVIPWILTGFFSAHFLFLLLGAYEVSALLSSLCYFCFRLSPRLLGVKGALSVAELACKHPLAFPILNAIFGLLILLGYFSAVTYIYFSNPLHSQDAIQQIFKLNLVFLLLGVCILVLLSVFQIVSRYIDDRHRQALFFNGLMSALPTGVILTVFWELLGISRAQPEFTFFGLKVNALYLPTLGMIAVFVVFLALPYFVGLTARRRYEIELNNRVVDWINDAIKIIDLPSLQDSAQLAQLKEEMARDEEEFIQSEPIVRIASDQNSTATVTVEIENQIGRMLKEYGEFKKEDLRFVYLRSLHDIRAMIDEIATEYDRAPADGDSLKKIASLAPAYVNSFKNERQEYEKKMEIAETRRVIAPILKTVIAILGSAVTVVEYGQRLIKYLPFDH